MLEWAHIKDKMNTFQKSEDKGKFATVYGESVKFMIFSTGWIRHAHWLGLLHKTFTGEKLRLF